MRLISQHVKTHYQSMNGNFPAMHSSFSQSRAWAVVVFSARPQPPCLLAFHCRPNTCAGVLPQQDVTSQSTPSASVPSDHCCSSDIWRRLLWSRLLLIVPFPFCVCLSSLGAHETGSWKDSSHFAYSYVETRCS